MGRSRHVAHHQWGTRCAVENGEQLEATAGHPFYVQGKGWNATANLKVGDALLLYNGTTVVVETVDFRVGRERVYNFSVAGNANYFVGSGGVGVHNVEGCRKGGGKNAQHGKADDLPSDLEQIEKLAEQLRTATGNEKKKIQQKIKNIKHAMEKRRKGVQHSQNAKGNG